MKYEPLSEKRNIDAGESFALVLLNDDVNTFDHVIKALVEVCGHDPVQAEQCAVITHFKGNCEIKSGNKPLLQNMRSSLEKRNLVSKIISS